MEQNNFNPPGALRLSRLIYFAMISGILFFSAVALTVIGSPGSFRPDLSDPLFIVLILLACTSIPFGYVYSGRYMKRADAIPDLAGKYPVYQSGLIIRLATCEGVALFSVVCCIVTGNLFPVIILVASLFCFILYYPTPGRIGNDLKLNEFDTERFYGS